MTVYLTIAKASFPVLSRFYAEHFATNQPKSTTIEVNCPPTPTALELKVVA